MMAAFLAVMLILSNVTPVFAIEAEEAKTPGSEQTTMSESPEPSQEATESTKAPEEVVNPSETSQEKGSSSESQQETAEPERSSQENANSSEPSQENREAGAPKVRRRRSAAGHSEIHEVQATITYIFKADGKEVARQAVKNGDKLLKPGSPEKEGSVFQGWYDETGTEFTNFDTEIQIGENDGNKEVVLEARFNDQVQVIFMEDNQGDTVYRTVSKKPGEQIKIKNERPPISRPTQFDGWYTDKACTAENKADDTITLGKENVKLYPKVTYGHYLIFETGDDPSSQPPVFVPDGAKTQAPTKPKNRNNGATFSHWSTTENGPDHYGFNAPINDNVTLYAVWNGPSTRYTVVYWRQKLDSNKGNAGSIQERYDRIAEEVIPANIGENVKLSDEQKSPQKLGALAQGFPMNIKHFTFNATDSTSGTVKVKADGSTELNVCYDRDQMILKWKNKKGEEESLKGHFEQKIEGNHPFDWWYTENSDYRMPFLEPRYKLTDFQKDVDKDGQEDDKVNYLNQNTLSLQEADPDNPYTASHSWELYEYYQDTEGSFPSEHNNVVSEHGAGDVLYVRGQEPYRKEGLQSNPMAFKPVQVASDNGAGYQSKWGRLQKGWYRFNFDYNIHIRYERMTFPLQLFNEGTALETQQVYYEKPLKKVTDEAAKTIQRPASVPSNYVLHWYWDDVYGRKVDFDGENSLNTMPPVELKLYGHWGPKTWKITTYRSNAKWNAFDKEDGSVLYEGNLPTVVDHQERIIVAGSTSKKIKLDEGEKWLGWTVPDGNDYAFYEFGKEVHEDHTLYARTTKTTDTGYTIKYKYKDTNGADKTFPDPNRYLDGTFATIKGKDDFADMQTTQPFSGWEDPDEPGKIYSTREQVEMHRNLVLEAKFGEEPVTVSLIYDGNGGKASGGRTQIILDGLVENEPHTVRSNSMLGFKLEDHRIVAWEYINKDGHPTRVEPGEKIMIVNIKPGTDGRNVLKAIWEPEAPDVETPNQEPVSFDVTKVWEDNDNRDMKRPEFVEVKLLANGEDTGRTLKLYAENNWSGRIGGLDVQKDGKDIVYTVEEMNVAEGYTPTVTGDPSTGFTITNTYKDKETRPIIPRMKRVVIPTKRIPRAGVGCQ